MRALKFIFENDFTVYPHFFIVYPCGKQWGYMEKGYKMQQKVILELKTHHLPLDGLRRHVS